MKLTAKILSITSKSWGASYNDTPPFIWRCIIVVNPTSIPAGIRVPR